jgi:hypothetical protein
MTKSLRVKLGIGLLLVVLVMVGRNLFGKTRMSDEEIDKLIYPAAPKDYRYPNPSTAALKRTMGCKDVYFMSELPRVNPLCLNVFKTQPEEISQMLKEGSYDRIVLYAEQSVFDAPTFSDASDTYIQNLYQNVKFMDQIAIPKLLAAYGLPDVSYIKVTKPYAYFYYRISSQEETDKICGTKDDKAGGCARSFYAAVIPLSAIGPQLSSALPVVRPTDKTRFSYLTHYPSDCYANGIFLHETSHLLNAAGQGSSGIRVMESWLNEQIAGYMRIYGAELVCGQGTVTLQKKPEVKDVPGSLAEFNSTLAAADLAHDYPSDNLCRQAILTEWYRYLSKGDYRSNFKRFFTEQRTGALSLTEDTVLVDFLLRLDPDPAARAFLLSNGCL